MIQLSLPLDGKKTFEILCLGAHSDDIEIGCGGTILRLAEKYPGCALHWVVFSAPGVREQEARHAAGLFTKNAALNGPLIKTFPDGFMPFVGAELKRTFEELKTTVSPDLIFTHYLKDAHQDHRLISELTAQTFRDHLILEYEVPKYDGDMGQPSVFVPLEPHQYQKKVEFLLESFESQRSKHWFQKETFLSLMRLRGMECNAPSGYAEAFYSHKVVLGT